MCSVFTSLALSCSIVENNLVVTRQGFCMTAKHSCLKYLIVHPLSCETLMISTSKIYSLKLSCGGQQQVHTVSEILHNKKPPVVY